MVNANEDVSDELVAIVQALVEDSALRGWFRSLKDLPGNRRYSELGRVAAKFSANGDSELAQIITSLNEPSIYRAVAKAVDDAHHGG